MKTIHIGNDWVEVPKYYVAAETEYTTTEMELFVSLMGNSQQEAARQKVLQKRIEFYRLFKSGKVIISEPPTSLGWSAKLWNYLT